MRNKLPNSTSAKRRKKLRNSAQPKFWRLIFSVFLVAIGSILAVFFAFSTIPIPTIQAQLPSLTTKSNYLPAGVEQRGTLEATGVGLDGKELIKIASPAVLNRNDLNGQIPVEVRAKQVESNLQLLVVKNNDAVIGVLEAKSIRVSIEILNDQPVLFVKDANLAEARVLLTVTDSDAQYQSISKEELAKSWKSLFEVELRQALEMRQPEALKQQIDITIVTLISTIALTILLISLHRFFGWRQKQLGQAIAKIENVSSASQPKPIDQTGQSTEQAPEDHLEDHPEDHLEESLAQISQRRYLGIFNGVTHYFDFQRRLQIVRFLQWLVFWAIAFIWTIGISFCLQGFPQTRQFANRVVTVPIVILFSWFTVGLLNRLADFAIDRFIQNREQDQSLNAANLQRIATIANVTKGLKLVLLYIFGFLWVLQWLKIAPESLIALGALITLAVSFAAQSLVKDLVNGFLILLEDQYRIGDYISVGNVAGFVENLNLRITQIRSNQGNLITIPNSLIAQVENLSRTWARTDFLVEVAYDTDINQALKLVSEILEELSKDPEWEPLILNAIDLLGVERISYRGIEIKAWIRTVPMKQWDVGREIHRRLKIAFDLHNIQIGVPQQMLIDKTELNDRASKEQD